MYDSGTKKRKKRVTMASKSLPWLRARGWQVGKVGDHWNAFAPRGDGRKGILQDLWGFADALICKPGEGAALVNWCAADRRADHVRTVLANEKARRWLLAGGRIFILSWRVGGPRGARKVWTPRLEEITLADFDTVVEETPEPIEETFGSDS